MARKSAKTKEDRISELQEKIEYHSGLIKELEKKISLIENEDSISELKKEVQKKISKMSQEELRKIIEIK